MNRREEHGCCSSVATIYKEKTYELDSSCYHSANLRNNRIFGSNWKR